MNRWGENHPKSYPGARTRSHVLILLAVSNFEDGDL
jgi:hypothetical protein